MLTISAFACASPSHKNKKQIKKHADTEVTLSSNDKLRYKYFFFEASRQQAARNYDAAFDLLQHAKSINPNAAEVYYALSAFYTDLKQDSMGIACLEKAVRLNPDNSTFIEYAARSYINSQQYDKAINFYELLADKNHKDSEPLQILFQLYKQMKNYPKMIEILNRIELQDGPSLENTINKLNTYELMGDKDKAYKELKSMSDEHPLDMMYKVMLGNWLMQNNRSDEAYKCYSTVLKEEPDNSDALSSLYDYYNTTKQDSLASKLLERLLVSEKTTMDTKSALMRSFISDNENTGGDSTKVLRLFDNILAKKQSNGDIAELKAAYMTIKKMPSDDINKALFAVLNISPDNANARIQLVQNLWEEEKYDSVIDLCKPALQYNPDELAFYFYSGMAFVQKKNSDEALRLFKKGVTKINSNSNPNVVSEFYGVMGDILHEKGLVNESFAAYDSCLEWKEDNFNCLNNYAYYLGEKNLKLDKAEEMSHKVILAEPKNATYLDTYAWILFCRGKYADAKIYIDQALANIDSTADNSVIFEHVGDIYSMNGMTTEALKYWNEALKKDSSNALVAKKIKLKKYIKE